MELASNSWVLAEHSGLYPGACKRRALPVTDILRGFMLYLSLSSTLVCLAKQRSLIADLYVLSCIEEEFSVE